MLNSGRLNTTIYTSVCIKGRDCGLLCLGLLMQLSTLFPVVTTAALVNP